MPLSKSNNVIWEKARSVGSGDNAVRLTDGMCHYLLARIAYDLGVQEHFPEYSQNPEAFYTELPLDHLQLSGGNPKEIFERLISHNPDADVYFACLAHLHKARLKYENILRNQPIPTVEQVAPRGLLHHGKLSPEAVVSLLFWRKWLYDLDNRASQETGYVFEPVIANSIGGTPISAKQSPVRRKSNPKQGRQTDCVLGDRAYELKLRVTIAASGQGRWSEELSFPEDCVYSGYTPVLVVLDGTRSDKLNQLERVFRDAGGEVYLGDSAWNHLDNLAGNTMSVFLENYIRGPIQEFISSEIGPSNLPPFSLTKAKEGITLTVGGEEMFIPREKDDEEVQDRDEAGDDLLNNLL